MGPFATIACLARRSPVRHLRSDSEAPRRRFHVLRVRAAFGGQRRLSFSASFLPLLPFRDFEKSRRSRSRLIMMTFNGASSLKSLACGETIRLRKEPNIERERTFYPDLNEDRRESNVCIETESSTDLDRHSRQLNRFCLSLKMCERMEGGVQGDRSGR